MFVLTSFIGLLERYQPPRGNAARISFGCQYSSNQRSNKVKMFLYELSLIIDTSTKSILIKPQS